MGRAAAVLFAREGAKVGVLDLDGARAEAVVTTILDEGGTALALAADVASSAEVVRAVEEVVSAFDALHILYNNAAVWLPGDGPTIELEDEIWARTLAVNLTGIFNSCRTGIPAIVRSGGGSVINTASPVAVRPEKGSDAYTASKGGVISLSQALAQYHAKDGVRVNVLMPGAIETAMTRVVFDDPAYREHALRITPLGRIGQPEDVARVALFLASEDSAFVTGSLQWADGGWLLGPELDEYRPT
jgi:NAD(P)-dependent dehydrogenase (short-subunit alcohol dehydrogenase family)